MENYGNFNKPKNNTTQNLGQNRIFEQNTIHHCFKIQNWWIPVFYTTSEVIHPIVMGFWKNS